MDQEPHQPSRGPGPFVTLILAGIPAGIGLFFLNLVSLGVFFWVMALVLGLVFLGAFHYVLWGHAMSEEVAGEREEQQIEDQMHIDRDE